MRCQQRPGAEKRGVKVEARHPHRQENEAGMTAVLDVLPTGATRGTDYHGILQPGRGSNQRLLT